MSRVGKLPVAIPTGVTVNVSGRDVAVKGSKGELKHSFPREVTIEVKDGKVWVQPVKKEAGRSRAMWGMARNIINNMVKGVAEGFVVELEINGVGYRAAVEKDMLTLSLGYSHEIKYRLPVGIAAAVKGNIIALSGHDRQKVGQVAAEIRSLRPPEPYKGKGVKRKEEVIRRKEGKKK